MSMIRARGALQHTPRTLMLLPNGGRKGVMIETLASPLIVDGTWSLPGWERGSKHVLPTAQTAQLSLLAWAAAKRAARRERL
jgi:hypothetical protein